MEFDSVMIEEQALKVRSLVYAKVPPDDFLDVMQDIRIAFLVTLPKYRGDNGAKLETYAHTVARRQIADYWRKSYHQKKAIKAMGEELSPEKTKIENYQNALPEPRPTLEPPRRSSRQTLLMPLSTQGEKT